MKLFSIVLIAGGILMLIFRGFNFTRDKKVADIGPIEINKQEEKTVQWPMYAGGIAVAAGVFLFLGAAKKNKA